MSLVTAPVLAMKLLGLPLFIRKRGFCLPTYVYVSVCVYVCVYMCVHKYIEKERNRLTVTQRKSVLRENTVWCYDSRTKSYIQFSLIAHDIYWH